MVDKYKYNVYADPGCFACKKTEDVFTKKKYDYSVYDINTPEVDKTLSQQYPAFKNDKSTPVIQKCKIENGKVSECTFTQGFREEDYQ